jgi:hypothetical protein
MDAMSEAKKAYRVEEFAEAHDISRAQTYVEIGAGRLIARKIGTRTIILEEDAEAWRRALPKMAATANLQTEERLTA